MTSEPDNTTDHRRLTWSLLLFALVIALVWVHSARQSLLVLAATQCDLGRAKFTVTIGAEVNPGQVIDSNVRYPAGAALSSKCHAVLQHLLDNGLNETSSNNNHAPYLHQAVALNHLAGLNAMVKAGFSLEQKDKLGRTVLFDAVESGKQDWVRIILETGASVNALSNSGDNPLAVATLQGDVDMVKLLLQAGARPNPEAANALCPLSLTLIPNSAKHLEVAQLLLEAGANLECTGKLKLNVLDKAQAENLTDHVALFSKFSVEAAAGADD
mgnify:CR=1 FL=1